MAQCFPATAVPRIVRRRRTDLSSEARKSGPDCHNHEAARAGCIWCPDVVGSDTRRFSEAVIAQSLKECDDLGAQRRTDYSEEKLFEIVNYRCQEGLPTIFTTNLEGDELAAQSDRMEVSSMTELPCFVRAG
jgi:hypothetical protein